MFGQLNRLNRLVEARSALGAATIEQLVAQLEKLHTSEPDPDADGVENDPTEDQDDVMEQIRQRPIASALPFAHAWSTSKSWAQRAAAAEMLAQRNDEEISESTLSHVSHVLLQLTSDPDHRVVSAALGALRDRLEQPYPEKLFSHLQAVCATHPDRDIRYAFVDQLFPGSPQTEQGFAAVIAMSADADSEIRSDCCFKLGDLAAMLDYDSHAIREALLARIDDPDAIVRSFAIEGLALRQDRRALPALARDLVPLYQRHRL